MYSNTILLVQPRSNLDVQLRTRLEGKGYSVIVAEDTADAMDIVNASEIGLVVTELYLRVGKSRCLARAIGRSPALLRTKLLAYTTHGKRVDRDWARQIGADRQTDELRAQAASVRRQLRTGKGLSIARGSPLNSSENSGDRDENLAAAASSELLDSIWRSLPLEERRSLLRKLNGSEGSKRR